MNTKHLRVDSLQSFQREGAMSNRAFLGWIRREVEERLGRKVGELSKTELFRALIEQSGPSALVSVGLSLKNLPANAILETIVSGTTPRAVLSRWARLERFSHTHNRTRILEEMNEPGTWELLMEHFALDGRDVDESSHLFIWGTLVALLERAGFSGVVARLEDRNGPLIYDASGLAPLPQIPERACFCHFSWSEEVWLRVCEARDVNDGGESNKRSDERGRELTVKVSSRVSQVIQTDIAHSWKLDEVARRLRVSPRHLQRMLRAEGNSFTQLLHQIRVEKSRDLLVAQSHTLTEIAFCLGYSDLAHYSRVARRYLQVAPSEFRELARPLG